jgi:hypothetical protein
MTQAELFTATETISTQAKSPSTVTEALAVGYDNPKAATVPVVWTASGEEQAKGRQPAAGFTIPRNQIHPVLLQVL